MTRFKQRLTEWRADKRAIRDERRKRLAADPRPGLKEAQRDQQSDLARKFPSSGAGG